MINPPDAVYNHRLVVADGCASALWLYWWVKSSEKERPPAVGFWRDAFGITRNHSPEAAAALAYMRDVFGAPQASVWARASYLAFCCVGYVALAGLMTLAAVEAGGGAVPMSLLAWFYGTAAVSMGIVVFVAWRWRRCFGSTKQRHLRAMRALPANLVAWAEEKPGEPEVRTPWWWLYSVSVIAALENWPVLVGRAGKIVGTGGLFLVPYLMWVHVRGTWGLAFDWFWALMWLAIGWQLPLDGLVKLAAWNGPGDFAIAVLRVGRRDYP